MNESNNIANSDDNPSLLRMFKFKNKHRLFRGHFRQLKLLFKNNIDALVLVDTKINYNFQKAHYKIEGYSMPVRLDRNWFGG